MRRNAALLVAAVALFAVTAACLLRLAQWRFDAYLRDTAAQALALSAQGGTPWRWRFTDAQDIVAGRVFEAADFGFADGALTARSDGRAFEIGLPLPVKADLRHFPQMEIAASLETPGRLWIVAAQEVGQPATYSQPIELDPSRSVAHVVLTALPATAAMLRLRVELPKGASLQLRRVVLQRAANAIVPDLDAPPRIAATVGDGTTNAELAAIAAESDVRTLPVLLLAPGKNPNGPRNALERVRARIPAAILIPADQVAATFAQARAQATARSGSVSHLGWIALAAWLLAALASLKFPPRDVARRAALEAVLASIAPIAYIASNGFTGRLDAAHGFFIAAFCAYALWLGFPRDWRFNGSRQAWLFAGAVVALAVCIGLFAHGVHHSLRPMSTGHIARYLAWALFQQFLICAVVTARWQKTGMPRLVAVWLGAMTFALMHTPNPGLMLATLVGGACWCALYLRERALMPLAFSHAASALALIALLPPSWLTSAEVSARFFQ